MKRARNYSIVALGIALVLLAIDPNLVVVPFKIVWALCFGWAVSAARLISRLQGHASPLAVWTTFFLILGLAVHRFCQALAASRNTLWKTRWTITAMSGLWLCLFAAMAVIGIAHQIGWIVVSREPWTRGNEKLKLTVAAMGVSQAAKNGAWTDAEIRKAAPFDWVELVIQHDAGGKITNVIVIHRDGRTGFIQVQPDGQSARRPMSELNRALRLRSPQ